MTTYICKESVHKHMCFQRYSSLFISQEREVKIKLTHTHKSSKKSGCQEADMKPIPYCRPTSNGHRHGNLIPRICASLCYLIHIICHSPCNWEYYVHDCYSLFPCFVLFSQMFTSKNLLLSLVFCSSVFLEGRIRQ